MTKIWEKLKAFGHWVIESRAWLVLVGIAGALGGLFLLAGRKNNTGALERERELSDERKRIADETMDRVERIEEKTGRALERAHDKEQELIRHAEEENRREYEDKAARIDEDYNKLDGADAARRRLRALVDKSRRDR